MNKKFKKVVQALSVMSILICAGASYAMKPISDTGLRQEMLRKAAKLSYLIDENTITESDLLDSEYDRLVKQKEEILKTLETETLETKKTTEELERKIEELKESYMDILVKRKQLCDREFKEITLRQQVSKIAILWFEIKRHRLEREIQELNELQRQLSGISNKQTAKSESEQQELELLELKEQGELESLDKKLALKQQERDKQMKEEAAKQRDEIWESLKKKQNELEEQMKKAKEMLKSLPTEKLTDIINAIKELLETHIKLLNQRMQKFQQMKQNLYNMEMEIIEKEDYVNLTLKEEEELQTSLGFKRLF